MRDPIELYAMTTDRVAAIVDTEPDPRAETPCPGWNYGQLLGHLVGGDRLFVAIIAGRGVPAQPRLTPDADQPPPTPADYREASGRLASVLQDPEVSAGVYQVPVGRLHGSEIVVLRSVEHLLHGWDLAVAGGVGTDVLEAPATALAGPAHRLLLAVGEKVLGERRPFGAPIAVADDASEIDRVVAMFGRDPRWQPHRVAQTRQ